MGQIIIDFNWKRIDGLPMCDAHAHQLEDSAKDRIIRMLAKGETQGELLECIHEGLLNERIIDYVGSWILTTRQTKNEKEG